MIAVSAATKSSGNRPEMHQMMSPCVDLVVRALIVDVAGVDGLPPVEAGLQPARPGGPQGVVVLLAVRRPEQYRPPAVPLAQQVGGAAQLVALIAVAQQGQLRVRDRVVLDHGEPGVPQAAEEVLVPVTRSSW